MSKARLLHMGGAVIDFVYRIRSLPTPGSERTADEFAMMPGGGFNLMAAAVNTGMAVAYGGQHGTGPNGVRLRDAFATHHIDVLQPPMSVEDSGHCIVLITADAERSFVSWPGVEERLDAEALDRISPRVDDWLFTSGYTIRRPASGAAFSAWLDSVPPDVPLVFDPSPVVADIRRDFLGSVLHRTDWLSCNSAEASIITGLDDLEAQAASLLGDHCPNAAGIVIRAGAAGSFLKLPRQAMEPVAGFNVDAIDTTGAGDIHIGVFVSQLCCGVEPVTAVRYANAAAAIAVTRRGGANAPTEAEIRTFLSAVETENRPIQAEDRDNQRQIC